MLFGKKLKKAKKVKKQSGSEGLRRRWRDAYPPPCSFGSFLKKAKKVKNTVEHGVGEELLAGRLPSPLGEPSPSKKQKNKNKKQKLLSEELVLAGRLPCLFLLFCFCFFAFCFFAFFGETVEHGVSVSTLAGRLPCLFCSFCFFLLFCFFRVGVEHGVSVG